MLAKIFLYFFQVVPWFQYSVNKHTAWEWRERLDFHAIFNQYNFSGRKGSFSMKTQASRVAYPQTEIKEEEDIEGHVDL